MKHLPLLLLTLVLCLLLATPASAALITLTDLNSTAVIDTASQNGMYNWIVDNYDVMYQQWFWYRIGGIGGEHSLDSLPTQTVTPLSPSIVQLRYANTSVEITVLYSLLGGAIGSNRSDISEQIRISNLTTSDLDFHFFQYSDFDLSKSPNLDFVKIANDLRSVDQYPTGSDSGPILSETTMTQANHAEANYFANTRAELNDLNPTTLNGVLWAGVGDVTWAFEWDINIGAHSSFNFSKDKVLGPVPEPAAITLLGGVLLLVATKLRKRVA